MTPFDFGVSRKQKKLLIIPKNKGQGSGKGAFVLFDVACLFVIYFFILDLNNFWDKTFKHYRFDLTPGP